MGKVTAFLKKELLEMVPPTIFFFIVFEIVVLARTWMGAEGGISMTTTAAALVGALVLGKSILIADALPLFQWFREPRLIANVVWRVFLYLGVALVFQVIEEGIPLAREYGGIAGAAANFSTQVHWPRFWATHMILALCLSFYSFITAVIDVLGEDRFREVFFGRKQSQTAS